jgi:hypothetical protein
MVRLIVYLICYMALLSSVELKAQEEPTFAAYLSGGAALTTGTLSRFSDGGLTGSAGIGLYPAPISSRELEIVVRLQYAIFPDESPHNIDYEYFTGGLDFKLNRLLAYSPNAYLLVGLGCARYAQTTTEYSPYATIGAGMESKWFVLETRLMLVFGARIKTSVFLPVTVGIRL